MNKLMTGLSGRITQPPLARTSNRSAAWSEIGAFDFFPARWRSPIWVMYSASVRHADPLFAPREGGLAWADPVECLLDLHEAKLDMQAGQFRDYLEATRLAKS